MMESLEQRNLLATASRVPGPVLEIKNLVTEFATRTTPFRAVNNVSLTVNQGETLCVVGESGSGKSVLGNSILQIIDPPGRIVSGQILLHRHNMLAGNAVDQTIDLASLHPRSKAIRSVRGSDIAMIFQEPMSSLSPVHTIGNQIGEVLTLHKGMTRKQARVRVIELLDQVGIRNPGVVVDNYPYEYSGGMRQRAVIAMALACDPKVLIADEPTTALDVSVQAEILALLKSLQQTTGTAVLFITHDMGVVAEIADRIAVMRYGELVEQADVHELFNNPQHDYTRALLNAVRTLDQPSPARLKMRANLPIGPTILQARNLSKTFAAVSAVKSVALELHAGENLGIVGESGSGKTTLGRCLQRVFDVSGGQILYTDRQNRTVDLVGLKDAALAEPWKDIRTVFQDPFGSLNPRMTVQQIIAEPLVVAGHHTPQQLRDRVAELLTMVGLPTSAMSRYPHAFSGGQRQRISIARAIAPDPRVIIADEATSALDVHMRIQILDLMLKLQKKLNLSYILISHDIAVIRYFCDRIAVMYSGEIVETGLTEEVCTTPQHRYTRALLSAVPIAHPNLRGSRQRLATAF